MKNIFSQNIVDILQSGGIGVLPTDTIYGLVGQALNPQTVERIYQVRRRQPDKPFIVLIGDMADFDLFNIKLSNYQKEFCQRYWPGAVSIVLSCPDDKLNYLHRNTDSLAFRLPDDEQLRDLIRRSGPLVAPSANIEGQSPAVDIDRAKNYFGQYVDFYIDAGPLEASASTLVSLLSNQPEILRAGAVQIE
ncbi:MAG TPA: L-threonylcarbamoyladenylate synthase, partial [bacterium]|nr:L-threonylcarbamoyladenylate synthase [bacterium]